MAPQKIKGVFLFKYPAMYQHVSASYSLTGMAVVIVNLVNYKFI